MTGDKVVTLRHGNYELELCPEGGGCMTAFRFSGIDVMRPASDEYWKTYEPRASSSFPLVPFSNRVADGRAVFEDEIYQFPINMPPEPHSIHGDGWRAAWQVEKAGSSEAILAHEPEGTPFPYASRQIFELSDDGLTTALEITNTGNQRVPIGFGHHPYFPRTEGLTLAMPMTEVWLPDKRGLPEKKVPIPYTWDFSTARHLAPLELDHDFTGGTGPISMNWSETGIRLVIEPDPIFAHVVVYVPAGRDFVCVEPITHVANAVNLAATGRTDTGLQILEPGEVRKGSMRFRVVA